MRLVAWEYVEGDAGNRRRDAANRRQDAENRRQDSANRRGDAGNRRRDGDSGVTDITDSFYLNSSRYDERVNVV